MFVCFFLFVHLAFNFLTIKPNSNLYFLGNNKPIKLMDYIRLIEKACSKKANLKLLPKQPGAVLETFADIAPSTEELGFSPKTNLDEGIPRFVEWFREYHK